MLFDENRLRDPDFFRENRLDAHSDHAVEPAYRLCLNGLWKFAHAVNPSQVIPGFEKPEYDCRGWNDIRVPAHIQLEGWGTPQYCNTEYPWDGLADIRPGELPENFLTKKEAQALGWDSSRNYVSDVAPGMSIGGDYFGNYEGKLPRVKGRKYYEADCWYTGGKRNAYRIIYSSDGHVWYTEDHYNTFTELFPSE